MNSKILLGSIIVVLAIGAGLWIRNRTPTSDIDQISYTIGRNLGDNLDRQGIVVNPSVLAQAVQDVQQKKPSRITPEQMQKAMLNLQTREQENLKALGEANLAKSLAFLKENESKPGVLKQPNGLQYIVLKDPKGKTPKSENHVTLKYTATLPTGELVDTTATRAEPSEVKMAQLFTGLQLGLMMMSEGAHFKLFIPPQLGYGASPRPGIPPQSVLIYDIELLKIK